MKKIVVLGANGQLGLCIKDAASSLSDARFLYEDKDTLDITDKEALRNYFHKHRPHHCINAAAYTNVEKAESEKEIALAINADGAKNIAEICKEFEVLLWHISTDYVFDGTKETPYEETDPTHPINVYGESKLGGEKAIQETLSRYFIIRTSWLYSQYGHNFYKSILKFAQERDAIAITTEQKGTPTNANDLAKVILELIGNDNTNFGLYHFSNRGEATWFEFAKAIVEEHGLEGSMTVDSTDYYPTFAKRPKYSVLNVSKISNHLREPISEWRKSLQELVNVTLC